MSEDILFDAYETRVESGDYRMRSMVESFDFDDAIKHILSSTEKKERNKISDFMLKVACDIEMVAFEQGFRKGTLLMIGVVKGGNSLNGKIH